MFKEQHYTHTISILRLSFHFTIYQKHCENILWYKFACYMDYLFKCTISYSTSLLDTETLFSFSRIVINIAEN